MTEMNVHTNQPVRKRRSGSPGIRSAVSSGSNRGLRSIGLSEAAGWYVAALTFTAGGLAAIVLFAAVVQQFQGLGIRIVSVVSICWGAMAYVGGRQHWGRKLAYFSDVLG